MIHALSASSLASSWSARCGSCGGSPAWRLMNLFRQSRRLFAAAALASVPRTMNRSGRRSVPTPRGRRSGCAVRLRGQHQYCRVISTFVKTSPFAPGEPYYGNSAMVKLITPTQDSRDIISAATRCLDTIWREGHRYQKAGVMLGDFYSQGVAQLDLFDANAPRPGSEALMAVLDKLNEKKGRGCSILPGRGSSRRGR